MCGALAELICTKEWEGVSLTRSVVTIPVYRLRFRISAVVRFSGTRRESPAIGRFFAGLMGLVDRDLGTVTRSSRYEVGGLERVEPHEVGQWMGGVFLAAGVTLGL